MSVVRTSCHTNHSVPLPTMPRRSELSKKLQIYLSLNNSSAPTTHVPTSLPIVRLPEESSFGEIATVPTAAAPSVYTEAPTFNIEIAFGEPLNSSLAPSSSPTNATEPCLVDAIALDTGNGDRFVSSLIVGRESEQSQQQQLLNASSSLPWTCQEPWGGSAQPLPTNAIWFSLRGNGGWLEVSTCSNVETDVQQRMHLIAGDCFEWMCIAAGQQNCLRGSSLNWLSEDDKQYWVLIHGDDGGTLDQDIGLDLRSPGRDRSELNSVVGLSSSPVPERFVSPFDEATAPANPPPAGAETSQFPRPNPPTPAPRPGLQNLIPALPPPTSITNVFYRSTEKSPRTGKTSQSIYSSFVVIDHHHSEEKSP